MQTPSRGEAPTSIPTLTGVARAPCLGIAGLDCVTPDLADLEPPGLGWQIDVMKKVVLIDDNAWEHIAGKLRAAFALCELELQIYSSADAIHAALETPGGAPAADF